MVKNAVSEMRRYYSRKVIDVLIKVTRRTLDVIIKQFTSDGEGKKYNTFLYFTVMGLCVDIVWLKRNSD